MGASLRSVCRDLNARGVRSVSGKLWASSTEDALALHLPGATELRPSLADPPKFGRPCG
jgi:hypothetical protein